MDRVEARNDEFEIKLQDAAEAYEASGESMLSFGMQVLEMKQELRDVRDEMVSIRKSIMRLACEQGEQCRD